jgi:ABC-type transport system involved in cytochrome bd biosynthesis fused ATPase/permease subunit
MVDESVYLRTLRTTSFIVGSEIAIILVAGYQNPNLAWPLAGMAFMMTAFVSIPFTFIHYMKKREAEMEEVFRILNDNAYGKGVSDTYKK